jgi:hypothetical protein
MNKKQNYISLYFHTHQSVYLMLQNVNLQNTPHISFTQDNKPHFHENSHELSHTSTTRMINEDKWYVTDDKTLFTISINVQ